MHGISPHAFLLHAVVTIEFQCMAYTVSEESGSVSLVVVKRGSSTSTIAVELSTVNQNATGKWIIIL